MPKKGERKPFCLPGDPGDPYGMAVLAAQYLEWMRVHNYAERTVENRASYLGFFIEWCQVRGVMRPREVTKPMLDGYQRYLFHLRTRGGEPLSFRGQYNRLVPVRSFFKWLSKQNYLLSNPASELELPRLERRLPRHVLTVSEVETVLGQPDTHDVLGLRDRAILEVLYSTGMRRSELIRLQLWDVDGERGTLMVRQGKGKKDRMIPIGDRAVEWVEKYKVEVRSRLSLGIDEGELFLTHLGEAFTPNRLTQLVRGYVKAAELGKRGSCHLFRHSMATLMLEHGADIRYIQQMLGHADVSTTQIYTQVSIRALKAIHSATHPGAKLTPHRSRFPLSADGAEQDLPQPRSDDDTARAELLFSLAAEADIEEADDAEADKAVETDEKI